MPLKGYKAHKTLHQDGGSDEVSVAALSGELADRQPSKAGTSVLGWTDEKLLKGAGVGNAPEEIDVPAGGAGVKVKAETKDMTAASGDVSYTGYGFTPTGLIIFAYVASNRGSIGSSDPAKALISFTLVSTTFTLGNSVIVYLNLAVGRQDAIVKSYDADGFTLTWTKTGSPTGTGYLTVFAFK